MPKKIKRTGSSAGFHFMNLYQCCPRKWYLRYLKGWSPKLLAKPLVLGSAFHEGKAAWYLGKGEADSIAVANRVLEESRSEVSQENYEEIAFRVPHLLHYWIEQLGEKDLQEYEVVHVEKELIVPIKGTEFAMTIRPDTILKSRYSGLTFIMETKTSGFSARVTGEAVYYGDQATAYMMGVRKCTDLDPYGVQPDIAYWNKVTRNLDNMKFERPAIVFRTPEQCDRFEMGVGQLFSEMSQKAEAYAQGYDPWMLFPKNTHYCLSFSTPCDFADVCSQDCEKIKKAPHGFRKEKKAPLGSYVLDTIGAD